MNGKMSCYNTRWVAKSFEQRESINVEKTFSLVIKFCNTRTLLALAAFYRLSIEQMHTVTTYLNSEIDVVLYIKSLISYIIIDKVRFFQKIIYGLKQSARRWMKNLAQCMTLSGLKRLLSDHFALGKNLETDQVGIIIVYIDDFLFFGPNIVEINSIKRFLSETYKMQDLGSYCQFTGIKMERQMKQKTICLSWKIYVQKLLIIRECQIANL